MDSTSSKLNVLVACEVSGRVRDAIRARGHHAVSCDIQPTDVIGPHLRCDVRDLLHLQWDMVIAFPPCTDLCASGARWFDEKRRDGRQQASIDFFLLFTRLTCRWAIENPVGIMSRLYRKPDVICQPWWFGHPETKATCLWLNGLPALRPTNIVEPDYMRNADGSFRVDAKGKRYSRVHFMSGRNPERAKLRSLTYPGMASAMANRWLP